MRGVYSEMIEQRLQVVLLSLERARCYIEIVVLKLHADGREEFRCKRVNSGVPITLIGMR